MEESNTERKNKNLKGRRYRKNGKLEDKEKKKKSEEKEETEAK